MELWGKNCENDRTKSVGTMELENLLFHGTLEHWEQKAVTPQPWTIDKFTNNASTFAEGGRGFGPGVCAFGAF